MTPLRRAGFTLVELVVTLLILLTMSGIAATALGGVLRATDSSELEASILSRGRQNAITSGRPRSVAPDSARPHDRVLFFPDGSGLGPGVDRLTGIRVAPK